jgi:hypothetical protein
MVAYSYNPNTGETGAGGLVQAQLGLYSKTLSQKKTSWKRETWPVSLTLECTSEE